jgi:D-psicose/D-tagatose/L-ribulose 3-epimerase
VDEQLSLKTAIWRNLWSDNVALAKHARAFIELGLETARAKAQLAKTGHRPEHH